MRAPDGTELRTGDPLPASGLLLALDWGTRRIGLAVSDPTQTVAHPAGVLTRRTGRRFPMAQLKPYLDEHEPVGIVIGLPLDPSGAAGPAVVETYAVAETIAARTRLPIAYWDERMSTARTRRDMEATGVRPGTRLDQIDALAATVLLQQFLDRRPVP